MSYKYNSRQEIQQDIERVQEMLVDVEDKMNITNISWTEQMNLYLFRTYVVEKLSDLNYQLSIYQD